MRINKMSFALLAAGALVLSGCSGTEGGGGDTALPGSDYNKVDREKLQKGGELKFAISDTLPANWNSMQVDGNTADLNDIYGFIAPANWIYAEDGTWEPNPDYVESFEVNDAPEGDAAMTVTLKLNPEAKWNTGEPITVADYQATWDACNDPEAGFQCASNDGWTTITSIEQGADEFEVVTNFNVAYPDWSALYSGIMPAVGMKDAETFNTGWQDWKSAQEWLAGPFVLDNVNEAQKVITLKPNPNWWGNEPLLDTVTFSALAAEAQGQAFANKEIDVVNFITNAEIYETAKGREDGVIKMSGSTQWRHFTFNSRAGALQDKAVRQAMQLGIDTADIAASDLAGLPSAELDLVLGNHFFMPTQEGYQNNATEYDPEGAKAKLEEAGYTMNETTGYFEKDGKELTVKYLRLPDVPASANEGAVLMDQMKEIGVKVVNDDVTPDDFFPRIFAGEYELTSFAWQGTPYPMANVGQIYGNPLSAEGQLVNSNFTGLKVDKVDEMIKQIEAETDHAKRVELTNEVDKIIWDEVMTLPLYYRANITAVPANLANYGATSMESFLPENIGFTEAK